MIPLSTLLSILVVTKPITSRLLTDPSLVNETYDFVVIGGGLAGNVVANRLTEDFTSSVLVIEAGPSNEGVTDSIVPQFEGQIFLNASLIWPYTTLLQSDLANRSITYSRGRMLGGSSSINGMIYNRGAKDDFNRIARLTGNPSWSWAALQPVIKRNEKMVPPADGHNTTGQFNPAAHSTKGLLETSLPGFPTGIDDRVIGTTSVLPDEFPFNLDMNSGDTIGVGWVQSTIGGGMRSSSATAYLEPALDRPNLDVLIQAQVTRLVQSGTVAGAPSFRKVEFAQSANTKRSIVTATKEVILSAGAIGTPQILMLSGIGNATALQSVGITPVVDLPDVGKNLQDHLSACPNFSVNSTDTQDSFQRNSTAQAEALTEWEQTHTGPLTRGLINQMGFLRLPSNASIFNSVPDPSSGTTAGHIELTFTNGFFGFGPTTGNFMSFCGVLLSPTSRGTISLVSSDPFTFPNIDPAFLSTDFDAFALTEAIKTGLRFIDAPTFDNYVLSSFDNITLSTSDADIESFIRQSASTVFHPVGTAAMSSVTSGVGVVDSQLRVKGVDGLRVVDASVFPFIPAGHTQGPTYIIAERATDFIRASVQ